MLTRVCIFCEKWGSGGIESFLLNVIEHMERKDCRLTVITAKIESPLYLPRLQGYGVPLVELSGDLRKLGKNHRSFRRGLRKGHFDVVHFNLYQALSLLYVEDAKRVGVGRRIVHSHNNGLRPSPTRWIKQGVHTLSKHVLSEAGTDWWACSAAAAQFMFPPAKISGKQVTFVPNGIDIQKFRPVPGARERSRAELGVENCLVIGHVGRLCAQKNQSFLLDVFSEVVKRGADSRLLIIGEGQDERLLRQKAERLGIAKSVIFAGTSGEIQKFYWAMDVFAFPSTFEGLGIAAVEAQAAGVPVLCSDAVPREAFVTSLAHALPLSAGNGAWAEKLWELQALRGWDETAKLSAQGYEIADVARWIERAYRGERPAGAKLKALG